MQSVPYITFNGVCREAMRFYQKCLGGELRFQTVGASPLAAKLPAKMKKCILHASLSSGKLVIFATDMVPDEGMKRGNNFSIAIVCNAEKEIKSLYKKLSKDGQATHPVAPTHWNALFGALTDKYGVQWMLHYSRK